MLTRSEAKGLSGDPINYKRRWRPVTTWFFPIGYFYCYIVSLLTVHNHEIRELIKQQRRQQQQERQKSNSFRLAKQQLYAYIMLFCAFFFLHSSTTSWNCAFSRFVEDLELNHFHTTSHRATHDMALILSRDQHSSLVLLCQPDRGRDTWSSTTFFYELQYSLLEFNSVKKCQHLTNWNEMD